MEIDAQTLLVLSLVGGVAGCVTTLSDGGSLIAYAIVGVVGAFVGHLFFTTSGIRIPIDDPLIAQIVGAAAGAMVGVGTVGKFLRSSSS